MAETQDWEGAIQASITAGVVDVQNVAGDILATNGKLRFIQSVVSGGGVITVPLQTGERTIIVLTPETLDSGQGFHVQCHANLVDAWVYDQFVGAHESVVIYVNPDLDTNWIVELNNTIGGTSPWFIFADTGFPLVDLAYRGQQAMAHSVPVAIASDQAAIAAKLQVAGVDVSADVPLAVQQMARTLVPQWAAFHQPAAATTATVTKAAAGAGIRNIIDSLTVSLRSAAGAVSAVTVTVWNGAVGTTALWSGLLSIPVTAGAIDRVVLTGLGLYGSPNTQMIVNIPAGAANSFVAISAAGWTQA